MTLISKLSLLSLSKCAVGIKLILASNMSNGLEDYHILFYLASDSASYQLFWYCVLCSLVYNPTVPEYHPTEAK